MKNLSNFLANFFAPEIINSWLYLILFFAVGVVYYISFADICDDYFIYFLSLAFLAFLLYFVCYDCSLSFLYLIIIFFVLGCCYVKLYDKLFISEFNIDSKLIIDGSGRVEKVIKKNYGYYLQLSKLKLCQADFSNDKFDCKKNASKNLVKDSNNRDSSPKYELIKVRKISSRQIKNNYLNLSGHQDLNRQIIDKNNDFFDLANSSSKGKTYLLDDLIRISATYKNKNHDIEIGDVIFFRAIIKPDKKSYFSNFKNYNKYHKISAFAFIISDIHLVKGSKNNDFNIFFKRLRQNINSRLDKINDLNKRAIIKSVLIGQRSDISDELKLKISRAGLSHLLAISGLHFSIIFALGFLLIRNIAIRSEFLAINFDVKKLAMFVALLLSFFYLKISGEAISAQRAFLMMVFALLFLLFDQKLEIRRVIILMILTLIILNPYVVFLVGFNLSILAVVAVILTNEFLLKHFNLRDRNKLLAYFIVILFSSLLIQILAMPILLKNFHEFSVIAILANLVAIPFFAFLIMPMALLLLFLMIFGFETYFYQIFFVFLDQFILFIDWMASFKYSAINVRFFVNDFICFLLFFLILAVFLAQEKLRRILIIIVIFIYVLAFVIASFSKKDPIIFDKKNKFFAIYDEKYGLVFSKKIRNKKIIKYWMSKYNEDEVKILGDDSYQDFNSKRFPNINCDKLKCDIIYVNNDKIKKYRILLKRNKISDICQGDFDEIINLNDKYLDVKCD